MNKATRFLVVTGIAAFAVIASVTAALAFLPRVPPVPIGGASLQNYLNINNPGPPPIFVLLDQLDAQVWRSSVSGNATFTLQIELAGNAANNEIGIYNAADAIPALYQVFPGAATAGWFATCHFGPAGALAVILFDENAVQQGTTTFYGGVNRNNFGFYLQNTPGGLLFYSQDYRNAGGAPQMVTYLGTDANAGDWWECFEDLPYATSDHDFEDAILLLQSVNPTAAHSTSWGRLKALYR